MDRIFYSGNILNAYSRGYLNVNALDYVAIPIKSGKYEIWVTYYGMESNHAFVEIIIEGDETKEEEVINNNTKTVADKDIKK